MTTLVLAALLATVAVRAAEKSDYELDVEGKIAVRFYATLQPLMSDLGSTFESVQNNIRSVERYIPEAAKYSGGYSNWYPLQRDASDIAPLRVPNFFSKDDVAALRAEHRQFVADYTELLTLNDSLTTYLKDAASKRDNFKKYTDAKPRLIELMEKVRADADALDARARPLAEAGEARTLPKNPYGVYILNMRALLEVAQPLAPLVNNPAFEERDRYEDARNKRAPETDEEKTARMKLAAETAGKIDAIVARITELADKQKAIGTEAIVFENKSAIADARRSIANFYSYTGDLEKEGARLADSLRKKGAIRNADALQSCLRNLISAHNRFVEMFNLWAGGTQAMKLPRD